MNFDDYTKAMETLAADWEEDGKKVVALALHNPVNISFDEFLGNCVCCGGDWGAMLLSGVKHYRPEVYDAIPEHMGVYAFKDILLVLSLLGVSTKKE